MQLRRRILALVTAAAVVAAAAFVGGRPASAAEPKVQNADKLKAAITKLYKVDLGDTLSRNAIRQEIQNLVASEKDKKNASLKATSWWSERVLEALYTGEKYLKGKEKTKEVLKFEVEYYLQGPDGPATKGTVFYRGPNKYSRLKGAPMLLSIVDAKTDPKAWIEKSWAVQEDFAGDWVLVAVAESEAFDVAKERAASMRVVGAVSRMFNLDMNRIFLEGVGSACKAAQISASVAGPDRLAGLILRNPQETVTTDNCGIFSTVVVKGPEGGEKAAAVFAKFKEAHGEARAFEITAPDVASVEGPCAPLAEWLKTAKPREVARSYSWTCSYDKDGNPSTEFTGTLQIAVPNKKTEPTKLKVAYVQESNTIDIQATNLGEFVVCINDDLLDLDKEVAIFVNGTLLKKKVFDRRADDMLRYADEFFEWGRLFPVWESCIVPAQVPAADKKPEGGGKPKKPSDDEEDE